MKIENKNKLYEAWIDPSSLASNSENSWEYMPNAKVVNETDSGFYPALNFAERMSVPDEADVDINTTVIGGICQIFTGDLEQADEAVNVVRMDQIVETVGMVAGMDVLFVAEDSLFAALTGVDQQKFTAQANAALSRLEKIARKVGATNLTMVLTSDIECALREQVDVLSKLIGNENFTAISSAPVMLMYTQLWSELLTTLGYLQSPAVVCIEPSRHFMQKQKFPDRKLQTAYLDFISWLQDQPYAEKGSRNQLFGAVGFSACEEQDKRTRLMPYQEVLNSQNYRTMIGEMREAINDFPFPLRRSRLFLTAINYLRWDEETLAMLVELVDLENSYSEERKTISSSGSITSLTSKQERDKLIQTRRNLAITLKDDYQKRAKPVLNSLLGKIITILPEILGD